jgi:hypothetical protein
MILDSDFFFSLIGAGVTIGALCVGFGVLKAKINTTSEKQKESATKKELAEAIKHSDDLLEIMQKRAAEDRERGDGRYKELYGIINLHSERIAKLEISQEQLFKLMDKLEATMNNGFSELKADVKEVQKSIDKVAHGA